MLAAAAREAGCRGLPAGRSVPDHPDEVLPAIEDQLVRADLMVTTGGVSMGGEHDVVKAALQQLGTITFRQGGHAAGDAAGVRTLVGATTGCRSSRCPATRSAPTSRSRSSPGPRSPRCRATTGSACEKVQAELTGPLRSPAGRRSFLRGVLDRAAGEGNPADRAGFAPDSHAGQGQRAGRGAGVGRADRARATPPRCWSCRDERERGLRAHARGRAPAHARMVDVSGKEVTARSACATGRVRLSRAGGGGRCAPGRYPRATRSRSPASPGSRAPSGRRT